jgi:hypothetical protein
MRDDDDAVVYYEDLLTDFGLKISRTHLVRLECDCQRDRPLLPLKPRHDRFVLVPEKKRQLFLGEMPLLPLGTQIIDDVYHMRDAVGRLW